MYAHTSYALRGTFATDEEGNVEVLTIAPGAYGPKGHLRAAHFHMHIEPPRSAKGGGAYQYKSLTTQLYICPANDPSVMKPDL